MVNIERRLPCCFGMATIFIYFCPSFLSLISRHIITTTSPDRLKITAKVEKMPWVGSVLPPNQSSFMSIHFRLNITIVESVFIWCDGFTTNISIRTTREPRQVLEAEWEKFFVLDGIPHYTSSQNEPCIDSHFDSVFPYAWTVGIPLCDNTFGHYDEMIYDPTLSSVFLLSDPNRPDDPSNNAPLRKSNKTAIIVGAVVASCVFVGLAIFILLVIFAQPVRQFFISSSRSLASESSNAQKRNGKKASSSSSATAANGNQASPHATPTPQSNANDTSTAKTGWTSAAKPDH
jgi:hypothetical protein